jgi:hypothetical protein
MYDSQSVKSRPQSFGISTIDEVVVTLTGEAEQEARSARAAGATSRRSMRDSYHGSRNAT